MFDLVIDCSTVGINDIVGVARSDRLVALGPSASEAMRRSRAVVDHAVATGRVVYGTASAAEGLAYD